MFLADITDKISHIGYLPGVEADSGLVEDQHLGLVKNGLRQSDALAVALGELADGLACTRGDAAGVHCPSNCFSPVFQMTQVRHKAQIGLYGHLGV